MGRFHALFCHSPEGMFQLLAVSFLWFGIFQIFFHAKLLVWLGIFWLLGEFNHTIKNWEKIIIHLSQEGLWLASLPLNLEQLGAKRERSLQYPADLRSEPVRDPHLWCGFYFLFFIQLQGVLRNGHTSLDFLETSDAQSPHFQCGTARLSEANNSNKSKQDRISETVFLPEFFRWYISQCCRHYGWICICGCGGGLLFAVAGWRLDWGGSTPERFHYQSLKRVAHDTGIHWTSFSDWKIVGCKHHLPQGKKGKKREEKKKCIHPDVIVSPAGTSS